MTKTSSPTSPREARTRRDEPFRFQLLHATIKVNGLVRTFPAQREQYPAFFDEEHNLMLRLANFLLTRHDCLKVAYLQCDAVHLFFRTTALRRPENTQSLVSTLAAQSSAFLTLLRKKFTTVDCETEFVADAYQLSHRLERRIEREEYRFIAAQAKSVMIEEQLGGELPSRELLRRPLNELRAFLLEKGVDIESCADWMRHGTLCACTAPTRLSSVPTLQPTRFPRPLQIKTFSRMPATDRLIAIINLTLDNADLCPEGLVE